MKRGFQRIVDDDWGSGRGTVEDVDPWVHAPEECGVAWDCDVAPLLENMPEKVTIYWRRLEFQETWVVVSFAVEINRQVAWKSIFWARSTGWKSNYGKPSVAAELDWSKHPALTVDARRLIMGE